MMKLSVGCNLIRLKLNSGLSHVRSESQSTNGKIINNRHYFQTPAPFATCVEYGKSEYPTCFPKHPLDGMFHQGH